MSTVVGPQSNTVVTVDALDDDCLSPSIGTKSALDDKFTIVCTISQVSVAGERPR